ncbi:hypothetical protein FRC10_002666 [Ceratobasidium sp. 414]|nr:hypothetical protein FRC10_002666 [Ceratobasidium sp. 414]
MSGYIGVLDLSGLMRVILFNTLCFLWFTAENVRHLVYTLHHTTNFLKFFVLLLSLGLRDPISTDPVPYPRYGFGIGRRTLLTPAPWAFAILFLVHLLFAGTAAFVQWTERGKEIVIRGLKWRWSALMLSSILWTATWVRQWYVFAWFMSIIVSLLATHTYLTVKKEFRSAAGFDWLFVYTPARLIKLPFALYDGWALFIFAVSTFAAFSPNALDSGVWTQILAIWILTLLAGTAHGHAFFTPGGNVPGNLAIAWGIFAVFANQVVESVKWAALALGILSVFAVAKSVHSLSEDIRAGVGGGVIRLPAEDAEAPSSA